MSAKNNFEKYNSLRKEYSVFNFDSYELSQKDGAIIIEYHFNIDNKLFFCPEIRIPHKDTFKLKNLNSPLLNNLIFNLGMVELISYWKCCCPTNIVIKPYTLTSEQIDFWKKLYFNGLGEFFYLNCIETTIEDFVSITVDSSNSIKAGSIKLKNKNVIPIGGGKDSAVSLNLISRFNTTSSIFASLNDFCMIVNPRKASLDTCNAAGYDKDNIIEVYRTIDPNLLELNKQGFLNGHTPFSAVLAFVSLITALITDSENVVLSNESSANESTVTGSEVNHQYSKSIEFETDFRNYVNKYIGKGFNYYSLLRPLSELQIAYLFSKSDKYFEVFRSCNAGSKTDIWCCKCPKCLFTFIILSPFIETDKLSEIFGSNLFDDKDMKFYFEQLTGIEQNKPFECVGTVEEVNIALCAVTNKTKEENLPYLLKYYKSTDAYSKYKKINFEKTLKQYNKQNYLPEHLNLFLKKYLNVKK